MEEKLQMIVNALQELTGYALWGFIAYLVITCLLTILINWTAIIIIVKCLAGLITGLFSKHDKAEKLLAENKATEVRLTRLSKLVDNSRDANYNRMLDIVKCVALQLSIRRNGCLLTHEHLDSIEEIIEDGRLKASEEG